MLDVIIRRLKRIWRTQTSIDSRFLMFFIDFHQKWHVWYPKMLSRKCNVWLWNARKNFLFASGCLQWLGESCLGPRVSPESNGVFIRRANRFLCHQTSAGGDFFVFKAFQSHFQWILEEKLSFWENFENEVSHKIAISECLTHRLATRKVCKVLLRSLSIQRGVWRDHTTSQKILMHANVHR